ncbi:hypothetical protein Taro_007538, partial [Colocasia esculenta]|nr:hypothetical protein [Colocasia esculenta]
MVRGRHVTFSGGRGEGSGRRFTFFSTPPPPAGGPTTSAPLPPTAVPMTSAPLPSATGLTTSASPSQMASGSTPPPLEPVHADDETSHHEGEGNYSETMRIVWINEGYEQTFLCKSVSTHPSMVSTHQHRFKGNMCKNVEIVSTHVKSVLTRVEPTQVDTLSEQVDTRPSSQNSQFEELGQQVDTLKSSVSTLPPGQVDTLRKLFILKVDGCHVSS